MSREEALLAWLKKVLDMPQLSQDDYSDTIIFQKLAEELPRFNGLNIIKSEAPSNFQQKYSNFKIIYQGIQDYYRDQLNSSFPSGLPNMNLLLLSKGQDKQSFMALLQIFFIACIECSAREKFITHIMNLEEFAMKELMNLIQQTSLNKQIKYSENEEHIQHNQANKIDELYFKIQSLYSENDALRNQFLVDAEQKNKLQATIKKLEDDKKKIRRQLDQKILYIQQKQQQELEEESTNKVMSQSNQQIITILKKQLLDQQHKYLDQKSKLKEQIYQLKQQLDIVRQKVSELQSESFSSISTKIKHENCVNINEHKSLTNKLQLKLKSKEQKQTELQRELVRMKYELEEKDRRIRKEQKQNKNIREQIQQIKNKGPMVKAKTARQIQKQVLIGIRDSLKRRLEEEKV